ncbi:hypothetical protein RvY_18204-1 [Ramazzottius varieornatus]|uniref:Uncharacterized protein n=1 Tax=Ramazzottius varieornatus TaxID=947166 RepID=A0A1D1WAT7_RAMVA|nr:hypothetical protein RvY_18204-1 [Ramazzottius varieornatus]
MGILHLSTAAAESARIGHAVVYRRRSTEASHSVYSDFWTFLMEILGQLALSFPLQQPFSSSSSLGCTIGATGRRTTLEGSPLEDTERDGSSPGICAPRWIQSSRVPCNSGPHPDHGEHHPADHYADFVHRHHAVFRHHHLPHRRSTHHHIHEQQRPRSRRGGGIHPVGSLDLAANRDLGL